jgi:hypothetical protein
VPENQPTPTNFEVASTVYWPAICRPLDLRQPIVASIKKGTVNRIYQSYLGKHERHYGVTIDHSNRTIRATIAHHTYESAHARATANLRKIIANYQHALDTLK